MSAGKFAKACKEYKHVTCIYRKVNAVVDFLAKKRGRCCSSIIDFLPTFWRYSWFARYVWTQNCKSCDFTSGYVWIYDHFVNGKKKERVNYPPLLWILLYKLCNPIHFLIDEGSRYCLGVCSLLSSVGTNPASCTAYSKSKSGWCIRSTWKRRV